jgi:hypothetical protein
LIHHRQIGGRVIANKLRFEFAPIRQGHIQLRGLMHHMAVRQDEPIGRENKPGTRTAPFILKARPTRPLPVAALVHFDVHHRRAYLLSGCDHGL